MKQLAIPTLALGLLAASCSEQQTGYYDQKAIDEMDKLTETISDLSSLSVYAETDVVKNEKTTWLQGDVYLLGNNNLHAYIQNSDTRKGYWYNGEKLTVYDFNKSVYDEIDVPETTLAAIDSVHHAFGIHFPAADFFYPTFTDDMINHFDTIVLIEPSSVEDQVEIRAVNRSSEVFLTIDAESHFPSKLEIYFKDEKQGDQYVGQFSNWRPNAEISESIFTFSPPENASKEVIFTAKH